MNKEYADKFFNLFDEMEREIGRRKTLDALGDMMESLDFTTVANMVRSDYDPQISKESFIEDLYGEGYEDAGFVSLVSVLKAVEEIINCDDAYGDFKFQEFVRKETEEEEKVRISEGRDADSIWYVDDNRVKKDDLEIQFEMEA